MLYMFEAFYNKKLKTNKQNKTRETPWAQYESTMDGLPKKPIHSQKHYPSAVDSFGNVMESMNSSSE